MQSSGSFRRRWRPLKSVSEGMTQPGFCFKERLGHLGTGSLRGRRAQRSGLRPPGGSLRARAVVGWGAEGQRWASPDWPGAREREAAEAPMACANRTVSRVSFRWSGNSHSGFWLWKCYTGNVSRGSRCGSVQVAGCQGRGQGRGPACWRWALGSRQPTGGIGTRRPRHGQGWKWSKA